MTCFWESLIYFIYASFLLIWIRYPMQGDITYLTILKTELCKLLNPLLWNVQHSPFTSPLLGLNTTSSYFRFVVSRGKKTRFTTTHIMLAKDWRLEQPVLSGGLLKNLQWLPKATPMRRSPPLCQTVSCDVNNRTLTLTRYLCRHTYQSAVLWGNTSRKTGPSLTASSRNWQNHVIRNWDLLRHFELRNEILFILYIN
jgi:hypothetical protein